MNTFKKITLTSAVAFALFAFNACGDDSNSTSASGENGSSHMSSSTPIEDLDESSSSINDDSPSSVTPGSSSSVILSDSEGSSSSSSAKGEGKSSSSSKRDDISSSSSSSVNRRCEEGALDTVATDTSTAYMRCLNNRWRTDSIVYVKPKVYPVMDSLFETKYSTYGSFEDPRDHQVYRTIFLSERDRDGNFVVDGKKIEVFAQNLNYGEMIDTSLYMHDDSKVEKYCDLNDEWFCNNGWGGRYTWSEAMALPAKYDSVLWKDTVGGDTRIHQGICPDDWHIMNAYEWKNYTKGGLALSSKVNWWPVNMSGANLLGLSVLFQMKTYKENWGNATFFLPVEQDDKKMYRVTVNDSYVTQNEPAVKHHNWFYVRCVRDY